jgi:pimeloyl-ACP methyl ester carboxylesterase
MAKTAKTAEDPADYIEPLYMNGLNGRMLYIPASKNKNREILVLYGHHALLERWWGLVQNFTEFGAVTMPDIPGFGGMDSFYKIGRNATLDNYADYMAAFIKMRYKRKRVSIVAISWGFLIATRMLQRNPELTNKVDFLISAAGFMRSDDFLFSRRRFLAYKYTCTAFSVAPFAWVFRRLALNAPVLRLAYARTNNAKHKFEEAGDNTELFDQMMDMEIQLWQKNDVRTYMRTTVELLTVDNCKTQIDLPVWHIYTKNDHFFDHSIVEQHMRVVFKEFHGLPIKLKSHTVSVIADKEEASGLLPLALKRAIRQADRA